MERGKRVTTETQRRKHKTPVGAGLARHRHGVDAGVFLAQSSQAFWAAADRGNAGA